MRAAALVLCVVSALGCRNGDAATRQALLATTAARHLVGSWDASFVADSAALPLHGGRHVEPVTGMMVFTLNRSGPYDAGSFRGITHEGAYDLDFSPFGFTTRLSGASVVVARVAERSTVAGVDSLWIVLSPAGEQFPVRMAGVVAADSAYGTWIAQAFTAGGGSGRFVMRRHHDTH